MALAIRLRRHGSRKNPLYRIVVTDSRSPRQGRFVEQVGTYDPSSDPAKVTLRKEQLEHWLKVGAQPSETVSKLIEAGSRAGPASP